MPWQKSLDWCLTEYCDPARLIHKISHYTYIKVTNSFGSSVPLFLMDWSGHEVQWIYQPWRNFPDQKSPEPWLAFCIFSGWWGGEVQVAGGMFDALVTLLPWNAAFVLVTKYLLPCFISYWVREHYRPSRSRLWVMHGFCQLIHLDLSQAGAQHRPRLTQLHKEFILIPNKHLIVTLTSSHKYFSSYTYLVSILALYNLGCTLSYWRGVGGGSWWWEGGKWDMLVHFSLSQMLVWNVVKCRL